MEGLKFSINAKSFYQQILIKLTNYTKLRVILLDYQEMKRFMIYILEQELLLNLFLKSKKVIGVESVPEAILDAKAMQSAIILQIASFLLVT
jgi:23S rRNA (uracil1939-C5)-methyltransferase